jgi:hypothetical protein
MSLPRNLGFALQRLSTNSKNIMKLSPLGTTTFHQSEMITFRLPNNSLIDLHSLMLVFDGITKQDGATAGTTRFARNIVSIIRRLEVVINGQTISSNLSDYNSLTNLLIDWQTDDIKKDELGVLSNGKDIVAFNTADIKRRYAVSDWHIGFLAGKHSRFIDTALLGQVELRFHLAPASQCVVDTDGSSSGWYELTDMRMYAETTVFSDGLYREVLSSRLKSGPIDIAFDNWMSFHNSATALGSTSFSVASQCVNKVIATLRATADLGGNAKMHYNGQSKYYAFNGTDVTTSQFVIDDTTFPQFLPDAVDVFLLDRQAFDANSTDKTFGYSDLNTWGTYNWFHAVDFTHHAGEEKSWMSGLDTRGSSSLMQYNVTGTQANITTSIYVNMTSIMSVSAGQVIQVIA